MGLVSRLLSCFNKLVDILHDFVALCVEVNMFLLLARKSIAKQNALQLLDVSLQLLYLSVGIKKFKLLFRGFRFHDSAATVLSNFVFVRVQHKILSWNFF
jgi:hypothetical protein